MITCRKASHAAAALIVGTLGFMGCAAATDISGAWATDRAVCQKVFFGSGDAIRFTSDSDTYGAGFVIRGNKIRGKIATCEITHQRQIKSTIHIIAACNTDVALSQMEFTVEVKNDDTLVRVFQGIPELNTTYYRCSH